MRIQQVSRRLRLELRKRTNRISCRKVNQLALSDQRDASKLCDLLFPVSVPVNNKWQPQSAKVLPRLLGATYSHGTEKGRRPCSGLVRRAGLGAKLNPSAQLATSNNSQTQLLTLATIQALGTKPSSAYEEDGEDQGMNEAEFEGNRGPDLQTAVSNPGPDFQQTISNPQKIQFIHPMYKSTIPKTNP